MRKKKRRSRMEDRRWEAIVAGMKLDFLNVVSNFYVSFYVHLYVDIYFYCKNFAVCIRKLSVESSCY